MSGEGLLGLQRAFQVSGARSVVVSLWRADDERTRTLMERFYERVWTGQGSKLATFRDAQLAVLRGEGGRAAPIVGEELHPRLSPHYWAGFVFSGDWR